MENNEANQPEKKLHWSTRAKMEREARAASEASGSVNPAPSQLFVKETNKPVLVADGASTTADTSIGMKPALNDRQAYEAEIARIRQTRKPFGSYTQKLALALRPGYHRHWFNDVPGRIDEAKLSGWTHVGDDKGQPVKRIVGTGRDKGALYAFAMEIPSVFWEEDQAAQFARAKAPMDAIKSSPIQAKPGQSKPSDNEKFYSPREQVLDIHKK